MAEITIVTTCMGRLEHLKQSLPSFAADPAVSVVVVDYSCPQRCGDWVEASHPGVSVVRVAGQSHFNASRARNAGAAASNSDWLFFLDCDKVLSPDFMEHVRPLLVPRTYHIALPVSHFAGLMICSAEDFKRAGGYDEIIEGWGGEDIDLRQRLKLAGVRHVGFPRSMIADLTHDDATRVAHYSEQDSFISNQVNLAYVSVKLDLMLRKPQMVTVAYRRKLYRKVGKVMRHVLETRKPSTLEIDMGSAPIGDIIPVFSTYRYTIFPVRRSNRERF